MAATGDKITVKIDSDLEDIVPGYLENRQKDLVKLNAALESGEFSELQSIGHKMKGSGGGYGFMAITDFGRTIEEGAKASEPDKIKTAMAGLEEYLANLDVVYE